MTSANRNLTWKLGIQDNASSGFSKVAETVESMGSRVGSTVSKLGSQLGGELGEVVARVGEGFSQFAEEAENSAGKLAAVGAGALATGLALSAMGSKDQQAQNQLKTAIQDTGGAWSDYSEDVEITIHQMEDYGRGAADTQQALATLTEATQDPSKAIADMGVVADLAAAKHESLADAATQVARILGGSGSKTLKQYGIDMTVTAGNVQEGDEAVQKLGDRLEGQASASVDTFTGRLDILKVKLDDEAATLGTKVGPALQIAGSAALVTSAAMQLLQARSDAADAAQARFAVANAAAGESAAGSVAGIESASAAETELAGSATAASGAMGAGGLARSLGMLGPIGAIAYAGFQMNTQALKNAKEAASQHGTALGVLDGIQNVFTADSGVAANKVVDWGKSLFGASPKAKDLGDQSEYATTTTLALGAAMDQSSSAFQNGADKLSRLTNAEKELTDKGLSAAQMYNTYLDSVQSVSDAVANATSQQDKNARSLDINTQAGRANDEAVLSAIGNINQLVQTGMQSGDTTDALNRKTDMWNQTLLDTATKAGLSAGAVQGLINTYENGPKTLAYTMVLNDQSVLDALSTVDDQLAYLGGLEKTDIGSYDLLKGSFNQFTLAGIKQSASGGVLSHASGGTVNTFDEAGGEMLTLPNGTKVMPHGQSMQYMRDNGGGGGTTTNYITVNVQGVVAGTSTEVGQFIAKHLGTHLRTGGTMSGGRSIQN